MFKKTPRVRTEAFRALRRERRAVVGAELLLLLLHVHDAGGVDVVDVDVAEVSVHLVDETFAPTRDIGRQTGRHSPGIKRRTAQSGNKNDSRCIWSMGLRLLRTYLSLGVL
jgi:hypothetical protein